METNRAADAFYRARVSRIPNLELPKIEPLPFKLVCETVVIPKLMSIKRLPSLNHKPRKTTYKTGNRFSAKRNRK